MKKNLKFQSVVAETLLIPLYMRAKESLRKEAILRDPLAEHLVEKIEYDYSEFDKARISMLGYVIHGRYYDDCVLSFINRHDKPVMRRKSAAASPTAARWNAGSPGCS